MALTGLLSLPLVIDSNAWNTSMLGTAVGLGSIILIYLVRQLTYFVESLFYGWLIALGAQGTIAVWEQTTGNHLENFYLAESWAYETLGVAGSFGNPNNFAAFLVFSVGVLVCFRGMLVKPWQHYLCYSAIAGCAVLVYLSGSRICLAAIALQIFIFMVAWDFKRKDASSFKVLIPTLAVLTAVIVATFYQLMSMLALLQVEFEQGEFTSGGIRINLALNGLAAIRENLGFGLGPGQFSSYLESGLAPYPTGRIVNPHNGYVEIGAEFGLLPLFALFLWAGFILFKAYRKLDQFVGQEWWTAVGPFIFFAGFSLASLASSALVAVPWVWLTLAVVSALTLKNLAPHNATNTVSEPHPTE